MDVSLVFVVYRLGCLVGEDDSVEPTTNAFLPTMYTMNDTSWIVSFDPVDPWGLSCHLLLEWGGPHREPEFAFGGFHEIRQDRYAGDFLAWTA
jgi:hypothetical protein